MSSWSSQAEFLVSSWSSQAEFLVSSWSSSWCPVTRPPAGDPNQALGPGRSFPGAMAVYRDQRAVARGARPDMAGPGPWRADRVTGLLARVPGHPEPPTQALGAPKPGRVTASAGLGPVLHGMFHVKQF
jgi:hypothetical protein